MRFKELKCAQLLKEIKYNYEACASLGGRSNNITGVIPIKPFHAWVTLKRENAAGRSCYIFILFPDA